MRRVFLSSLCWLVTATVCLPRIHALDTPPPAPSGPVWEKITPLLDQSIAALTAGDTARAEDLRHQALALSGFLGADSIPPDATLVAHAERALEAGFPDVAIIDYRESLSSRRLKNTRLILSKLLIAKGAADEALPYLNEIFRAADDYGAAQLLIGKIHLARYAQNHSLDDLAEAALALAPPTRSARNVLTPAGEIALKELNAALEKLPPDQRAALSHTRTIRRLARAHFLFAAHEKDEALPVLNELLAEDPFCTDAYELRIRISDYEKARNAADAKIVEELKAPAPQIPEKGVAFAAALANADRLVHQRPFDAQSYVKRVMVRLSMNYPTVEQAKATYDDAKIANNLDPYDPETFQMLCEAFIAQKRAHPLSDAASFQELDRLEKAAIWAADSAVTLAPKEVDLLLWRAAKQQQVGEGSRTQTAARALLFLNRAVAQAPTNLAALYARAETARSAENFVRSAQDYRELIRLDPAQLVYSYNLGWVLMSMNKFRAAAAAFENSIPGGNVPDDARSLQALALAFAGDPKAEELAANIPEHSVSSGGVSTAQWNIGHNKNHTSPLIERVAARLQKATR